MVLNIVKNKLSASDIVNCVKKFSIVQKLKYKKNTVYL